MSNLAFVDSIVNEIRAVLRRQRRPLIFCEVSSLRRRPNHRRVLIQSWRSDHPKFSGLQKGPAERGHVKKPQNSSKSVKNIFDNFRAGQKSSKSVKITSFSTLFDNFRAAPFFRASPGQRGNKQVWRTKNR